MEPLHLPEEVLSRLPLFPLPTTVFFPGTELKLHVFEQRYRELVRHCLDTDRAMAVVLLQPGYEKDYGGRPPIYEVAGAGRITHVEELPDGRYDIVLWGNDRVRVVEEHPPDRSFRIGRCERIVEDERREEPSSSEHCLRSLALRLAGCVEEIRDPIIKLLDEVKDGSGDLADQIACRLIPDPLMRQAVLEEEDIGRRLELVTREVADVCLRVDQSCRNDRGPLN